MVGMRNEAYCGVCQLWLRGGNTLYSIILERIAGMANISEREKLYAASIVADGSKRHEQSN